MYIEARSEGNWPVYVLREAFKADGTIMGRVLSALLVNYSRLIRRSLEARGARTKISCEA